MPELPEVETMRRGIVAVVGSRITGVARAACRLKPIRIQPALASFRRRAVGQRIAAVGRIGKRVVLTLDNRDALVLEPRMTGLVLLSDPPDTAHLRFLLDLEGGPADRLWYWDRRGLGSVRLLSPREVESQLGASRIGPDALSLTALAMKSRLGAIRRAVKVAMLDQQIIAGVGNLYAAEILHHARIHPSRQCSELSDAEWNRLHASMHEILDEAIRYEGSTLADGTYRNAMNDPGSYQAYHRVYGHAGRLCPSCGRDTIQRMVQAQRSTFFCGTCQPLRGQPRRK